MKLQFQSDPHPEGKSIYTSTKIMRHDNGLDGELFTFHNDVTTIT